MTRPVKLEVTTSTDTKAINATGRAVDKLADDVDHLGREMATATRKANELDRATRRLGAGAAAGGGGTAGRAAGVAGGAGRAASSAAQFQALPINPIAAGVGLAAGAVASPFIGGVAGGATIGAAGLGAVGLGVAGAAKSDPRIEEAFHARVKEQATRWQQASRDFVEPTLRGIEKINDAINDIGLEDMLKRASAFADPLFSGVAGTIREVGLGLADLVEHAAPVIDVLRNELPQVGASLRIAFEEIGAGSEGGAAALKDFMDAVQTTIIVLGKWVHLAEDFYEAGIKFRQSLPGDAWNDDVPSIQAWGGAMANASIAVDTLATSANQTADALANYKNRADELFGATMSLVDSTLAYESSIDELSAALAENKGKWDAGTAAGRAHIAATQSAIEAAYRHRQAMIDSGQSVAAADAWFRRATDGIMAQARAAGADAGTIGMLTSAWRNYLSLPSGKVFKTTFITEGTPPPRMSTPGRQFAFAEGGTYEAGQPRMVGERGVEIDIPAVGGRVLSHADAMRAVSQANSGTPLGGGGGGSLQLVAGPGGDSGVAQLLHYLVRTGAVQLKSVNGKVAVAG